MFEKKGKKTYSKKRLKGKELKKEIEKKLIEKKKFDLSKIIPKPSKELEEKRKEFEKKKKLRKELHSVKVIELLLTQLAEKVGINNVYEIIKLKKQEKGWYAIVKINDSLFGFLLDDEAEVEDFEELKEGSF